MKVVFVAVAAVLCAVASQVQAEPVCSPTEESVHPHPDCTKYWVCAAGSLVVVDCPGGLFFNPEIGDCDWPHEVPECVGGTRPPEGTTPAPTTRPPTTIPTTTTRPPTTTTPSPPPTTTPTTRPPTVTTPTTTRPSTEATTTPLPNGCPPEGVDKIPYPGSCTQFFICLDGEPHLTNCTGGLYFNPITKECDDPENVDCGRPTQPPTTTRPTTTTPTTTRPTTTTTRPPTTGPTQGPSEEPTEGPISSPATEEPGFTCPGDQSFIYMPHPTDCDKFYSCRDGQFGRVYSCGEDDFWFRFATQSCILPWGPTCSQD